MRWLSLIVLALVLSSPTAEAKGRKKAATKPVAKAKNVSKLTTQPKSTVVAKRVALPRAYARVAERPSLLRQASYHLASQQALGHDIEIPDLSSTVALVTDERTGEVLLGKNTQVAAPIASITKLMTAMVALDQRPALDEQLTISEEDFDTVKSTGSRLRPGLTLTRGEMLLLALMSSENRAASALSRHYPGGTKAFVAAMNRKAAEIGMRNTRFVDPTGLHSSNMATGEDLVKLVRAAYQYPEIREASTTAERDVVLYGDRPSHFLNSNTLVRNSDWEIGLSKTGFISEAGRCLVMQARVAARPVVIVLLDSAGKNTRVGDANRIRKWMEQRLTSLDGKQFARRN